MTRKELLTRLDHVSTVLGKWMKNPSLIEIDENSPNFANIFSQDDRTHKLRLGAQWIGASEKSIDKYSTFIHEAAHFNVYKNNIKILNGGLHQRFNGLDRARELGKLAGAEGRRFGSRPYQALARQNPWNIANWVSGVPARSVGE